MGINHINKTRERASEKGHLQLKSAGRRKQDQLSINHQYRQDKSTFEQGYLSNRKKKRPSRANETGEQKAVRVSDVLVRRRITRGGLK